MEKWYKGIYRRHLLDMHINDDKDLYLSKFNAQTYFNNLKNARVQSPMIYLQSHTGLCNFPTKTAKVHKAMTDRINGVRELITLCKNDGMKVVGYYSLIFNNWAEDNHPEWAIRYANGQTWAEHDKTRYGLCCPNNVEYRKFVVEQIKELFDYYGDIDGIFFDMPYWEVLCHCDSCKNRFEKEYGIAIPDEDLKDSAFRQFMVARQNWMAEFCNYVKGETLKIKPNITVEFNYAAAVNCGWLAGSTEKIAEQMEFVSGDLLGGLRKHSFACKYYYEITNNQPFEYMNTRCDDCLREHTISKTQERMLSEVMLNCAHHGASLSIDAINLDGTMDERVYERVGKTFERQLPYEKNMDKGKLYSEIAVYYNSDIQFSINNKPSNKECCLNVHKTLCERHLPCTVLTNFPKDDLSKFKAIIAPSLTKSENAISSKLIEYVKNGGFLYLSGESDADLIKEFFGAEVVNRRVTGVVGHFALCYVSPKSKILDCFGEFNEEYPLPLSYYVPEITFDKGEVVATLNQPISDPEDIYHYGSIHSNPPANLTDKPVMLETTYGKGKVFWSLAEIENDEREGFKDVFISILNSNIPKSLFSVKSNKNVEVITFIDGNKLYMNFYDYGYEYAPEKYNTATISFENAIKVESVNGEKLEKIGDNSFKIDFNLFGSLVVEI